VLSQVNSRYQRVLANPWTLPLFGNQSVLPRSNPGNEWESCPIVSVKSRRDFLKWSLAGGLMLAAPLSRARSSLPPERDLKFYNTHTGEQLRATYWADGQFQESELAALNHLLRDYRNGEVRAIDPQLFDILYRLQQRTGVTGTYEVISGYRSPATNALLHRASSGVARNSLHTHGQAIDVRLGGIALADLRRAALEMRAGGVGYYPHSDFIHLDTGRVRYW
jgi:uncharacterized protein YcbK (DUF882 family)